ncbi:iron ABC transporter permease [Pelagibius sp. CAU 1746]|uniref:ABC transporter permease n=1 Tax=Pelagibius sp. CAU 1746 TaxID=3140370 RepID=UPI00325AE468
MTDKLQLSTFIALTACVLFLVGYPLFMLVTASFEPISADGGLSSAFRGYFVLFDDIALLGNSMVVAIGSTVVAVVFGVGLGWIVARTNVPCRGLLEALIVIPFYLTPLMGAVGWALLASPNEGGALNAILMKLGVADTPVFDIYTPLGIIWVMGIYFAPFPFLFAVGALRSMDPSLEESSHVLGSNQVRTSLRITLPLIMPAILGSSLLVFVLAVGQFGVPAILGMPNGYHVLTTKIYQFVTGFQPDYAAASAMGLSLLTFTAVGVYLQFKVLGTKKFTTVTGRGFRPKLIDMRGWRLPLFAIAFFYIAIAVILPIGVLLFASLVEWITFDFEYVQFTLQNFDYVINDHAPTMIAIVNTLLLAFSAGAVILLASVVIAWMLHRSDLPGRRLLEYISMIPIAVPAVVFSVGLLWAWTKVPVVPIYGTLWILAICYITIFLPYGIRAVSATLVQIDKSLEECASVMGASWARVLRTVTFPLLAPGLWAGWTILFISVTKELTASALLYNSKTVVLSVAVFDLWAHSSFTNVAALSLIQAAIIFLALGASRIFGRAQGSPV